MGSPMMVQLHWSGPTGKVSRMRADCGDIGRARKTGIDNSGTNPSLAIYAHVHNEKTSAQYPQLFRSRHCLCPSFNAKLAVDMAGMGLDRVQRNEQLIADFLIRT